MLAKSEFSVGTCTPDDTPCWSTLPPELATPAVAGSVVWTDAALPEAFVDAVVHVAKLTQQYDFNAVFC